MNEVFRFTTVSTGFYWFIKRLDLCGSIWGLTNSCGTGFLSDCQWNWFPIFVLVLFSRGLYVEWCGETVVIVRLPADFPSFSYFFWDCWLVSTSAEGDAMRPRDFDAVVFVRRKRPR